VASAHDSVSLTALRKARSATQVAIGDKLGMSQSEVSRLERRADMYASSLARYVEAVGGHLEMRARFPKGEVYTLRLGVRTDRRRK
jgi:transcriptional regulator with XRE-family HTH domain